MSTVIKFKKSSDFESTKKISNQLLSDKEVRRIFQFLDHDILAYKVLDDDVNEYLDFDFKDLNDLDKTKNIYMRVQVLSNQNFLPVQREELPGLCANCSTTSTLQASTPSSVSFSNQNLTNELVIKEESYIMDKPIHIEILDHMLEDIDKNSNQIHDKIIEPNSNLANLTETYKFPLEEIFHFPNLCSALDSKSLMMGNEDTLLRILYDSIKRQSSNHAISYENVIDSLFLHFPYLAESYGDLNNSRNIWKVKLTTKFANERQSFISNVNSQETRTLDDSCLSFPSINDSWLRVPSSPKNMKSCTSTTKLSMSELLDCNVQEEICSPSYKKNLLERDLEKKKTQAEGSSFLPETFSDCLAPLLSGKMEGFTTKKKRKLYLKLEDEIILHLNKNNLINSDPISNRQGYKSLRAQLQEKYYPSLKLPSKISEEGVAYKSFIRNVANKRRSQRCRNKDKLEKLPIKNIYDCYDALKNVSPDKKYNIPIHVLLMASFPARKEDFFQEIPFFLLEKRNILTEVELRIGKNVDEFSALFDQMLKSFSEFVKQSCNFDAVQRYFFEPSIDDESIKLLCLHTDKNFDYLNEEHQRGVCVVINNDNLIISDTKVWYKMEGKYSEHEAIYIVFGLYFILNLKYPSCWGQLLGLLEIVVEPRCVKNVFVSSLRHYKLKEFLKFRRAVKGKK